MPQAQTAEAKGKWKGKEWYQILSPKYIGDIVIGETLATEPDTLKGRVVETSLMDLTGDPSKYYVKLYFKVIEVANGKAMTKFIGHEMTRDFIARAVQARTARIDTNDIVTFADGRLRIKTIAITNRPVSEAVEKAIRASISKSVVASAKDMKIEDWVSAMAAGEIQQGIRAEINKLYPVRLFEFRASEFLEG
jgi:small subunit ribosomal protein S3Ae